MSRGIRAGGRLVGATLDGFVAGFAAGYVALTAISGADRYLGFGPAIDILVSAVLVLAALGTAWALLLVPVVAAGWARDRLAARPPSRSPVARGLLRVLLLPLRIVAAIPRLGVGLMAAVLVLVYLVVPVGIGGLFGPAGALAPWVWFAGFVGALVGLAHAARAGGSTVSRALSAGAAVGAVAVAGWALVLAFSPGSVAHLVAPGGALDGTAAGTADAAVAPGTEAAAVRATLPDPGAAGPFPVTAFTYGSGTDRREAFGASVRLRTPTVDATAALDPLDGFADEARAAWWGFGRDALPLNARVWMPEGDGPFPLVLVVHGNHAMGAPNEAGYAYLGEHLASRGFITASVDESFLNGSWAGDWKGAEMRVRAWLLLLHVDQWRRWNAESGGPLEGRVDMDRVALIGHSRGGEAASVAASWAGLDGGFDPTLAPWPEGLHVRAVVSIAPSDGQIGHELRLRGVDFLALSGGHDADARAWSGIRQYNRTTVGPGGFKAALYASRANHGQFNTTWGSGDHGAFSGGLLDLAALLTPAEQEDVAKTAIGAFLEASLAGRAGYRDLFRRPMAGREWLPDDVYAVRSDTGGARPLLVAAGGGDVADGLTPVREALAGVRSGDLPLRALQDTQAGRATMLRWDAGPGQAGFGVEGIGGPPLLADAATPGAVIRLELANTATGAGDVATAGGASHAGDDPSRPIEIAIEARTTSGVIVALPLSRWGAVPPPLVTRLTKDDVVSTLASIGGMDLSLRTPAEQVVQTWHIPLADLAALDPAFRVDELEAVVLRIPRTEAGGLAVVAMDILPPD